MRSDGYDLNIKVVPLGDVKLSMLKTLSLEAIPFSFYVMPKSGVNNLFLHLVAAVRTWPDLAWYEAKVWGWRRGALRRGHCGRHGCIVLLLRRTMEWCGSDLALCTASSCLARYVAVHGVQGLPRRWLGC